MMVMSHAEYEHPKLHPNPKRSTLNPEPETPNPKSETPLPELSPSNLSTCSDGQGLEDSEGYTPLNHKAKYTKSYFNRKP